MVTRMKHYDIEPCTSGACGNPEKADRRNKSVIQARKDFEAEKGRPPKKGEFNKWLLEEA